MKSNKFYKQSGLNSGRTLEELYVHHVNSLVSEQVDISSVYDHEEYIRCSKEMSPMGDVEEPNMGGITAAIGFAIVAFLAINIFGGI